MLVGAYTERAKAEWDAFVGGSKNGTFLFQRDYMEYHGDRFQDASLLIREGNGRLLAVLPANREDDAVFSHAGLTYGGFAIDNSLKLPALLGIFDEVLTYWKSSGVAQCTYKTVPHIYHRQPAEEDRYALFLAGARWVRSGTLAVVRPADRIPYQERRARGVKKARQQGLTTSRSGDVAAFWRILSEVLREFYGTRPVHSLEEILLLSGRFPENIKLYGCFGREQLLAGVLIYETALVARAQYIASSQEGRESGALDLLFDYLLGEVYRDKLYFDFGSSDEDNGRRLNHGLMEHKEGFGARGVALDQYVIDLGAWTPGNLIKAIR